MKDKYDVVIIGAGPAGLSCARELQSSGKSILLVEKNSKIGPKICAGGLTTKVKLQNPELLEEAAFSFSSIKVTIGKRTKIVNHDRNFVSTISREKLGEIMLSNILKNLVDVAKDKYVKEIGDNFIIIDGKKISFDYLVGADGSNSMVRKYLGVKTEKFITAVQYSILKNIKDFELITDAHLFGSHYAWIFPHKDHVLIGAGGCKKSIKASDIKKNLDKWMRERGYNTEGIKPDIAIINYDYRGFNFGNKFLVGDAGGFASGLTGEGIYFGIVSGREVARKIINPNYSCRGVNRIIRIKKHHERALSLGIFMKSISPSLLNLFLKTLMSFSGSKKFVTSAIRFLS